MSKYLCYIGFPSGSDSKESACSARDLSLISWWGRYPAEGHGNPLQYPCLGNFMGPWGVKESDRTEWPTHTHTHTHMRIYIKTFISTDQQNQAIWITIYYNVCFGDFTNEDYQNFSPAEPIHDFENSKNFMRAISRYPESRKPSSVWI